MKDHVLYVKLFGAFQLTYDDKNIIIERNDVTKCNQLFQILLCHQNGIQKEVLIMYLFGNDSVVDSSNSLRGLVFRLRKILKSEGIVGGEYIKIERGMYRLDPELKYEVDVLQFKRIVDSIPEAADDYEKIKMIEAALELYRGEVLPKLGAENWVVALREKYKNIYIQILKQYVDLCMSKNEYQKIINASTKALRIYPFDEWQTYSMDALITLNRTAEAIQIYRETETRIQDEYGATVSDQMYDQMKEISARLTHQSAQMNNVLNDLESYAVHTGGFECSYISFAEHYQMLKYDVTRNSETLWLMMITVIDSNQNPLEDTERCKLLMDELVASLHKTLRKMDVFTRYSQNQVLILLKQKEHDGSEAMFRRLKGNLEDPKHEKYYQCSVEEIE